MTAGGAGAYPVDVAYPALFHRECGPAWIATAVTAIGQQAPSVDRPFRYLYLGCGSGLSAALFAAAYPQGSFVGVDANARHIAEADGRTRDLANLRFLHADFDALSAAADDRLGAPFDFIVAHGVYSWIDAASRAALRRITTRRLAPGGILYLHYTSHPGHSAFAGAQAMLRRIAALTPGTTAARVGSALALLRALDRGGAGYLRMQPAVAALLRREDAEAAYLAHDLLAPDWAALHSGAVIDDMAAAGCTFVGSAALLDNVDALSVPGHCLPVIAQLRDVAARETARDLARNQSVRRDLYRRGLAALTPEGYRRSLGALRFRRVGAAAMGDLGLATPIGPVSVDAAMVDPLRRALADETADFSTLLARHPAARDPAAVLRAVLMMMAAGEIHPVLSHEAAPSSALWRALETDRDGSA